MSRIQDTKKLGDLSEMEAAMFAIKQGIEVSKPIGDRYRYDQIWDINGKLLRIQVKSPHISNGAVEVNCKSMSRIKGKSVSHPYNGNEIDAIVVPYNDNCYMLLPKDFGKNAIRLRFESTSGKNKRNIKWLNDYSFDIKIKEIL